MAMLDVRLLCDTEFVVGIDSVATFFCSLLRASNQTFSTPPPFCVGGLACVELLGTVEKIVPKGHDKKSYQISGSHNQ